MVGHSNLLDLSRTVVLEKERDLELTLVEAQPTQKPTARLLFLVLLWMVLPWCLEQQKSVKLVQKLMLPSQPLVRVDLLMV